MTRFAFLVHPFLSYGLANKFPFIKNWPPGMIELGLKFVLPFKATDLITLTTPHGQTEGYLIVCPLTPRGIDSLPPNQVIKKVIQSARYAQRLGAEFVGLDFSLSVIADIVAEGLHIPVITGKTYTLITALSLTSSAANQRGISLDQAEVLVAGADCDLGSALAELLAVRVKYLTICSGEERRLDRLARYLFELTGTAVRVVSNPDRVLAKADLVFFANKLPGRIDALRFKSGAIVCDLGCPSNFSREDVGQRGDVLFVQGGTVQPPDTIDPSFYANFPSGNFSPALTETVLLALEGKVEDFACNREISLTKMKEIELFGKKHGFKTGSFSSSKTSPFEREIRNVQLLDNNF
jgi:fatty aldehyde-generating acyl-ACP reductase